MLEIKELFYNYPDGTEALKDISIQLPHEHIVTILGESGSGKTTLLKCIGKFLKPQKGIIKLNDENIYDIDEVNFRKSIGIVFQDLYLFPHLTVLENMTLAPKKVLKKEKKEAQKHAKKILKKLGIEKISKKYPSQISGGQAQRVAIARGLVLEPEYLLLDEPTAALDINTTKDFGEWLKHLKANTTFVVVTHDTIFAKDVASKGVALKDGVIVARGDVDKIIKSI